MRKAKSIIYFVQFKDQVDNKWKDHNCNYHAEPYGFGEYSDALRRKNRIVEGMAHPERGPIFRVDTREVDENAKAAV